VCVCVGFVMCECVGFLMCGCFEYCVGVLVICVLARIYCGLYCLYCVHIFFLLCIFILIFCL